MAFNTVYASILSIQFIAFYLTQVCSTSPKDSVIPEVGLHTLPKAPESMMYGDYPLYPG